MIRKEITPDVSRVLAASLVVFLLLLFLTGRFIYQSRISKLLQIKRERSRIELENKVGKQLGDLKKIREKLPSIKESSIFLGDIAKLAGQLDMKLVTISAMPVQKFNDYTKFSVRLDIDTTYHELGNFISRLETAGRFIYIDSLEMAPAEIAEKTTARLLVKINLSTINLTDTSLEI
ncbi:MAG: type 4a pilus biogenesis protein PilO [Gammaproteobacteria bacterium]|nr:type 4a pilus biogenesis protein PilO [Gammaproteobacteria bacterium]